MQQLEDRRWHKVGATLAQVSTRRLYCVLAPSPNTRRMAQGHEWVILAPAKPSFVLFDARQGAPTHPHTTLTMKEWAFICFGIVFKSYLLRWESRCMARVAIMLRGFTKLIKRCLLFAQNMTSVVKWLYNWKFQKSIAIHLTVLVEICTALQKLIFKFQHKWWNPKRLIRHSLNSVLFQSFPIKIFCTVLKTSLLLVFWYL